MVPYLSSVMLSRVWPFAAWTLSGRAVDFTCSKLARDPEHGISVPDTVTVRHPGPIGGPNHRSLRGCGASTTVALHALCKGHHIDPKIVTRHAVDRHEKRLTGDRSRQMSGCTMLPGCVAAMRQSPGCRRVLHRMQRRVARTVTLTPCRLAGLNATGL